MFPGRVRSFKKAAQVLRTYTHTHARIGMCVRAHHPTSLHYAGLCITCGTPGLHWCVISRLGRTTPPRVRFHHHGCARVRVRRRARHTLLQVPYIHTHIRRSHLLTTSALMSVGACVQCVSTRRPESFNRTSKHTHTHMHSHALTCALKRAQPLHHMSLHVMMYMFIRVCVDGCEQGHAWMGEERDQQPPTGIRTVCVCVYALFRI